MRIVYVIEKISGIGGMERIVVEKMNWIAQKTHHEIILLLLWHDDGQVAYQIDGRIRVIHLNVPYVHRGLTYPLLLVRYNSIMEELKPDVVDMVWIAAGFMGLLGKRPQRENGKPSKMIYELHSSAQAVKFQWMHKLLLNRVDAFVTLTERDRAYYDRDNVVTIHNFTSLMVSSQVDYAVKNVVSLGRDSEEKDFTRMRRLFDEAKANHSEWSLDIYNDVKDVVRAYQSGSIFLMTSKHEGFGLVLIEAMTCGLPCIAFDCPNGPREIIEDGVNGFLIPYGDDRLFVEKLCCLMDNPTERERMGKAARQSMRRFEKQSIMNQWLKLFTH